MNELPNEVLVYIFHMLPTNDKFTLMKTGRRYKQVGRTPDIWYRKNIEIETIYIEEYCIGMV